jgi:hypothetical protein
VEARGIEWGWDSGEDRKDQEDRRRGGIALVVTGCGTGHEDREDQEAVGLGDEEDRKVVVLGDEKDQKDQEDPMDLDVAVGHEALKTVGPGDVEDHEDLADPADGEDLGGVEVQKVQEVLVGLDAEEAPGDEGVPDTAIPGDPIALDPESKEDTFVPVADDVLAVHEDRDKADQKDLVVPDTSRNQYYSEAYYTHPDTAVSVDAAAAALH